MDDQRHPQQPSPRDPGRGGRGGQDDPATVLRAWAQGLLPVQAATELLLRAFDARFTRAGFPWVRGTAGDGLWLDWELMTGRNLDSYSGGEQRLLRVAASLGGGLRIDLAEAATGLDPAGIDLMLAAVAHAAGVQQLHPWPATR